MRILPSSCVVHAIGEQALVEALDRLAQAVEYGLDRGDAGTVHVDGDRLAVERVGESVGDVAAFEDLRDVSRLFGVPADVHVDTVCGIVHPVGTQNPGGSRYLPDELVAVEPTAFETVGVERLADDREGAFRVGHVGA